MGRNSLVRARQRVNGALPSFESNRLNKVSYSFPKDVIPLFRRLCTEDDRWKSESSAIARNMVN